MCPDQFGSVRPIDRPRHSIGRLRRQQVQRRVRHHVHDQAFRHVFADRLKIMHHVVDEDAGQGARSVKPAQYRPFRFLAGDKRIFEAEPVKKPASLFAV